MERQVFVIAILVAAGYVVVHLCTRRSGATTRIVQSALVVALCVWSLWAPEADAAFWAATGAFSLFLIGPVIALRIALRGGVFAAPAARMLPVLWWGASGLTLRDAALASLHASRGEADAAEELSQRWRGRRIPQAARALLALVDAVAATHRRDWEEVIRAAGPSVSLEHPVQLLVARAEAELGRPTEAWLRIERVVRSPSTAHDGPSLAVAELAACAAAGDLENLERAARTRGVAQVDAVAPGTIAYWRGRCLLVSGDPNAARAALSEALALYPGTSPRGREVIQSFIDGTQKPVQPASLVGYERARDRFFATVRRMSPWARFLSGGAASPVVIGIIAVCAALLAPYYIGDGELWNDLTMTLANIGVRVIDDGEAWRLLTALFLHANLFHFGFNALALLLFGGPVERLWGPWVTLLVFLVSGMAGHLLSAVWHDGYTIAVGASTGVYGILALYIITFLKLPGQDLRELRRRRVSLLLCLVAVDVMLSLFEPRIDTAGHVGGLVVGALLGAVIARPGARKVSAVPEAVR